MPAWWITYSVVESLAVKVPGRNNLEAVALGLSPGAAVRQGREESESANGEGEEGNRGDTVDDGALAHSDSRKPGGNVVEGLAQSNGGKVQRGEVVVKEELALHQVEGEVVESPAEYRHANLVIKAFESGAVVVTVAALPAEDGNNLEDDPSGNGGRRRPPDDGVADEVDLGVVATPEVDAASEDGPALGARIPGVRVSEAGVGPPHDLVQLQELAKEAQLAVVGLVGVWAQLRALVVLDVPETVGKRSLTGASDFLLFGSPSWKLDLVGKEYAAGHDVDKAELRFDNTNALLGDGTLALLANNLHPEVVVGITVETFVAVGRDLVLPVLLADGRTDVVGVEATVGVLVV